MTDGAKYLRRKKVERLIFERRLQKDKKYGYKIHNNKKINS
jgi:hypothetical protein